MKYQNLNVLSKDFRDSLSSDAVAEVQSMINAKGNNRKQRRDITKSLNRMKTILEYSQRHVDRSAYNEYQKVLDKNYVHFFSCMALTMIEQYHWKESEDDEHGQISSLIERVDKTIRKYAEQGLGTEDIADLLEEKTGIKLVADNK